MQIEEFLQRMGGVASAGAITRTFSEADLRRARRAGALVQVARGRYALPDAERHRCLAHGLTAALSHLSAARHWGLPVKFPPDRPWLTVPRGRNVPPAVQRAAHVHWAHLDRAELAEGVTGVVRTVLDCARALPFDEAVCVADSALRCRLVTRAELLIAGDRLSRVGRSRALGVVEFADRRAANPFESSLRCIVASIRGASFEPQVPIAGIGQPDLVDVERRLVLEADSFEFHGSSESLARDIERYNALVSSGWTVLRFGWRHVMFESDYVRATIEATLSVERSTRRRTGRKAA